MGLRGTSCLLPYGAAIFLAAALAFPFVCAMFLLLSFGMGFLAWFAIAAIVFSMPPVLFAWWFVWKRSDEATRRRAGLWHVWAQSVIVHLGFSAGFCRVWPYMPNAPHVEQGPFATDYLQVVFLPAMWVWELSGRLG